MIADLFLVFAIILFVISLIFNKKIQEYAANFGAKQGSKIKEKYEFQPPPSDEKIIQVLAGHRRHSLFYVCHIVREARTRESPQVTHTLEDFNRKTKGKFDAEYREKINQKSK